MNEEQLLPNYPALEYPATHLYSFLFTPNDGTFLIAVKGAKTLDFKPDCPNKFLEWLNGHKIRDVLGKTILGDKNNYSFHELF